MSRLPHTLLLGFFAVPFIRYVSGTPLQPLSLVDESVAIGALLYAARRGGWLWRHCRPVLVISGVTIVWILIASLANGSPVLVGMRLAASLLKGVPVFLAILAIETYDGDDHRTLVRLLESLGVATAGLVIFQQLYTEHVSGTFDPDSGWGFIGTTDSCYFLHMVFVHHLGVGLSRRKIPWIRLAFLGAGIVKGYTNHALLFGAAVGVLVMVVVEYPRLRSRWLAIVPAVAVAFTTVVLWVSHGGGHILGRSDSVSDVAAVSAKGLAYSHLYEEVLMSPRNLVMGVGPGEFGSLVGLEYGRSAWAEDIRTWLQDAIEELGGSTADHPNSSFIALLGELGAIGLLLVYGLYILVTSVFLKGLASRLGEVQDRGDFFGGFAGLFLLVVAVYSSTLENVTLVMVFWIFSGSYLRTVPHRDSVPHSLIKGLQ